MDHSQLATDLKGMEVCDIVSRLSLLEIEITMKVFRIAEKTAARDDALAEKAADKAATPAEKAAENAAAALDASFARAANIAEQGREAAAKRAEQHSARKLELMDIHYTKVLHVKTTYGNDLF